MLEARSREFMREKVGPGLGALGFRKGVVGAGGSGLAGLGWIGAWAGGLRRTGFVGSGWVWDFKGLWLGGFELWT